MHILERIDVNKGAWESSGIESLIEVLFFFLLICLLIQTVTMLVHSVTGSILMFLKSFRSWL